MNLALWIAQALLAIAFGVIGLAVFGVGAGFVSKLVFPQRLVYEYPDTVADQGIRLGTLKI